VGAGVEKGVETARRGMAGDRPIELRLLGPIAVRCDGLACELPASRKVRALLAYLAIAPQAATRSHLCELLWDVPNDPRGELRWCLSKLRKLLDAPGRRRITTAGDTVRLDLSDCFVDAAEVARATQAGIETLGHERLRELVPLIAGEFLDGLEIERSPLFASWVTAQRRRFRACHAALLEHLAGQATGEEAFGYLERWVELAPFDQRVHELMLSALARDGHLREGEEHLAATLRLFESEGLDGAPIREAWRRARSQAEHHPRIHAVEPAAASLVVRGLELAIASPRRASIAVMPFVDRSRDGAARGGSADGLAYDVITRLAKLRTLFVIAQGTVFALHERRIGPEEAGRMLNVDYVGGGWLDRRGSELTVSVELTETRTARIVWAEVFTQTMDNAFLVLDEIGDRIVASIASEIETMERNRAMLRPPNSLDAWEAHHRGLWHMYRFNRADNARAREFFETAVGLDPTFARAHAGLSFTHWQDAFQGWAARAPAVERAFEAAGQSLMVDDRDPAAHCAMGRALWLRGQHDESVLELQRTVDLSPNFALGHYALSFVHSQSGDPAKAVESADHSRQLSPFDPLLCAMLGARAMALVRLGRVDEAGDWGEKAAARPNAHDHIRAIAAYSQALAGRLEQARAHFAAIRKTNPRYGVDDLLAAMQFDASGAALFRKAAKRI